MEHLTIRILCEEWGKEVPRKGSEDGDARRPFELEGHEVSWTVGPKKLTSEDALRKELERIWEDPATWQKDAATGRREPMRVVLEPGQGATYGDVMRTLDLVVAARFVDVNFGGGTSARERK